MITSERDGESECGIYREGSYWIEYIDTDVKNKAYLYHDCKAEDSGCDILLVDEVFQRACRYCGPLEVPDNLWVLYVMLGGYGVYSDEEIF